MSATAGFGAAHSPTLQGLAMEQLWFVFLLTGIAVAAIVYGLILWSVIAYRRRSDALPPQFRENVPLEIAYTLIPLLIVAGLFVLTMRTARALGGRLPLERVGLAPPPHPVGRRSLGRVLAGVDDHVAASRTQLHGDPAGPVGAAGVRSAPSRPASQGGGGTMSTSSRVLLFAAAFSAVVAAVYWFVSYDPAGTILLGVMAVGLLIAAAYLGVAARGGTPVAGDDPDLRSEDVAGAPVGTFPRSSGWPIVLAAGLLVGTTGLLYGVWLAVPGLVITVAALVGLMQESRPA